MACFDGCVMDEFGMLDMERFVKEIGYELPFGFWFISKGKEFHVGKRIITDKNVLELLEDMEVKKYRHVDVYIILPEKVLKLGWDSSLDQHHM